MQSKDGKYCVGDYIITRTQDNLLCVDVTKLAYGGLQQCFRGGYVVAGDFVHDCCFLLKSTGIVGGLDPSL